MLTIGSVHGGNRSNIIADEVRMLGTLRTFNEQVRETVRTAMRQTLAGCTSAHGAQFELNWEGVSYPVTFNDPALVEKSVASLKRAAEVKQVAGYWGRKTSRFIRRPFPASSGSWAAEMRKPASSRASTRRISTSTNPR